MRILFILLIFLSFILLSCHKNKGNEECVWTKETTGMGLSFCEVVSIDLYEDCSAILPDDSVRFNRIQFNLHWETQYLNQDACSSPHDSVIGIIENLWVIALSDYNLQYRQGDTLNEICTLRVLDQLGQFSGLSTLPAFLSSQAVCTTDLYWYLNQPPAQSGPLSFRLIYQESEGKSYADEIDNILILL